MNAFIFTKINGFLYIKKGTWIAVVAHIASKGLVIKIKFHKAKSFFPADLNIKGNRKRLHNVDSFTVETTVIVLSLMQQQLAAPLLSIRGCETFHKLVLIDI